MGPQFYFVCFNVLKPLFLFQLYSTMSTLVKWTLVAMVYRWISNFSHRSNSLFNGGTFWRFSRLMMLHVPRTRSMTNWASICGLRCNQKENRNTHHTVGPTGIDVEHHLQGNYDTRTTIDEIFCLFFHENNSKHSFF